MENPSEIVYEVVEGGTVFVADDGGGSDVDGSDVEYISSLGEFP